MKNLMILNVVKGEAYNMEGVLPTENPQRLFSMD
jgi:hypothetical protein